MIHSFILKKKMSKKNKPSDWIVLKVRERIFETTKSTLKHIPYFQQCMNVVGESAFIGTTDEPYFIDRDPKLFKHILRYATNPAYAIPSKFLYDLTYWGLDDLIESDDSIIDSPVESDDPWWCQNYLPVTYHKRSVPSVNSQHPFDEIASKVIYSIKMVKCHPDGFVWQCEKGEDKYVPEYFSDFKLLIDSSVDFNKFIIQLDSFGEKISINDLLWFFPSWIERGKHFNTIFLPSHTFGWGNILKSFELSTKDESIIEQKNNIKIALQCRSFGELPLDKIEKIVPRCCLSLQRIHFDSSIQSWEKISIMNLDSELVQLHWKSYIDRKIDAVHFEQSFNFLTIYSPNFVKANEKYGACLDFSDRPIPCSDCSTILINFEPHYPRILFAVYRACWQH